VQQGKYDEAMAHIAQWRKADDNPWIQIIVVYVLGRSGHREQAKRELEKSKSLNWRDSPLGISVAYIGMDDKDQAFAWLEKAYAAHSTSLTALKVDPTYDPLRSDPRFQDLLHRMGLQP
jgi:tetratricopeptide (TPR) repeat protein